MPLLHKDALHPITLPDGTLYRDTVHLNQAIDHPRMEIGDFSYFTHSGEVEETASMLAPYLYPISKERLIIGKFVQIAREAYFITSTANHALTGISTFPFRAFNLAQSGGYPELPFKDTIIGHDVWIGHGAVIMPGVSISDGAIIGAGSCVTKDVAPYMIVGGNPAKPIRRRFDDQTTERLLALKWWDWPHDKIERNFELLEQADVAALEAAH